MGGFSILDKRVDWLHFLGPCRSQLMHPCPKGDAPAHSCILHVFSTPAALVKRACIGDFNSSVLVPFVSPICVSPMQKCRTSTYLPNIPTWAIKKLFGSQCHGTITEHQHVVQNHADSPRRGKNKYGSCCWQLGSLRVFQQPCQKVATNLVCNVFWGFHQWVTLDPWQKDIYNVLFLF